MSSGLEDAFSSLLEANPWEEGCADALVRSCPAAAAEAVGGVIESVDPLETGGWNWRPLVGESHKGHVRRRDICR
jgi:hypothetical protein